MRRGIAPLFSKGFRQSARISPTGWSLLPDDWRLEEALGYRYWFAGVNITACEHFSKAAELGSENPRMYFEYALLLGQEGRDPSEQEPLFEEALRLLPEYAEARYRLAYCYLRENEYAAALSW